MEESEKPSHVNLTTSAEQELTPLVQDEVLDMEVDSETRDTLISKRMKSTALKLFHDDDHFINSIIERCPSGRCRLFKTRTAWGTDSFYRYMYMAKTINDCIFFFVKDFFSNFDSIESSNFAAILACDNNVTNNQPNY